MLKNAEKLSVLKQLPGNCCESADCLEQQRDIYEKDGIFSSRMIDGIENQLRSYNDRETARLAKENPMVMQDLVNKYFYCG